MSDVIAESARRVEAPLFRLLLDAGENWAGRIGELEPDWIAITYVHPDHAFGRREGTERPVSGYEAPVFAITAPSTSHEESHSCP